MSTCLFLFDLQKKRRLDSSAEGRSSSKQSRLQLSDTAEEVRADAQVNSSFLTDSPGMIIY